MSDDRVAEVEQALQAEEANVSRELSAFEAEQAAKGWDPSGEKSAEEWHRAAPLYNELKERGKEIKQLRRTVDELKQHMQKQDQIAYNRALAELSVQRTQAIKSGNVDLVDQIDNAKQDLNHQISSIPDIPDAVIEFKEKYDEILNGVSYEHMQMAEFIRKRDAELFKKHLSPEDHMATLEEHLHKEFKDFFQKSPRNSVEAGYEDNVAKPSSRKKAVFNDLNPTQKQIARDFERMGVMKPEEYIKQLLEAGEIK